MGLNWEHVVISLKLLQKQKQAIISQGKDITVPCFLNSNLQQERSRKQRKQYFLCSKSGIASRLEFQTFMSKRGELWLRILERDHWKRYLVADALQDNCNFRVNDLSLKLWPMKQDFPVRLHNTIGNFKLTLKKIYKAIAGFHYRDQRHVFQPKQKRNFANE